MIQNWSPQTQMPIMQQVQQQNQMQRMMPLISMLLQQMRAGKPGLGQGMGMGMGGGQMPMDAMNMLGQNPLSLYGNR